MTDLLPPLQTARQVRRRTALHQRTRTAAVETWPTVGEAGKVLGVGPQRVRDLVSSGELDARRGPHGMRLINPASLDALCRKRAAGRSR